MPVSAGQLTCPKPLRHPGCPAPRSRNPSCAARSSSSAWSRGSPSTAATAVVAVALPLPGDALPRRAARAGSSKPSARSTGIDRVDVDLRDMTDDELVALGRLLKGVSQPRRRPTRCRSSTPPHAAAPPPRVNPFTDARTRVLAVVVGQGRRRQVVGHHQPLDRARAARPPRRRGRRRRVGLLDAADARHRARRPALIDDVIVPPEANGVRLISMGFFAREDQAGHLARARCCTRRSSSSSPTSTGTSPTTSSSTCRPAPATSRSRSRSSCRAPRCSSSPPRSRRRSGSRSARRRWRRRSTSQVIGVIENMSWFTGDDGKRYELFGAGGGEELADELGVPLLGQLPLVPALREGGDDGRPIVVADPDGEVARCSVTSPSASTPSSRPGAPSRTPPSLTA